MGTGRYIRGLAIDPQPDVHNLGLAFGLPLLELYVARAIGGVAFMRAVDEFTSADRIGLSGETIEARVAAYERAAPFVVRS
jgi:hypothetical protein